MSTELAGSGQLSPLTPADSSLTVSDLSQKAWHLFSLLLSLGRPAHPLELASLCTLFPAPPELVCLLCRIPSSPIHMRSDLRVAPSLTSLIAFFQLMSNSSLVNPSLPPRIDKAYYRKRKRSASEDELLPLVKRRVTLCPEEGLGCCSNWRLPGGIRDPYEKVEFLIKGDGISAGRLYSNFLDVGSKLLLMPPLFANISGRSTRELRSTEDEEYHNGTSVNLHRVVAHSSSQIEEIADPSNPELSRAIIAHRPLDSPCSISYGTMEDVLLIREENKEEGHCLGKRNFESSSIASLNEMVCMDYSQLLTFSRVNEDGRPAEALEKELLTGHVNNSLREPEQPSPDPKISSPGRKHESESRKRNEVKYDSVDKPMESQDRFTALECSAAQKVPPKHNAKSRASHGAKVSSRKLVLCESVEPKNAQPVSQEKRKVMRSQKLINAEEKIKHVGRSTLGQERKGNYAAPVDQSEAKVLPDFESYIVEEEEGSGGYGTVYRAKRRNDGRTVAIKYPHANAHKHHIINELKVLERFGGKNFIIKYEGCFKSGSSDCFVLEHVNHDRPELLKKEINVLQLQWYGYCLFKALASLHKQGVVHRDVKPGNFLFSRDANKGYLIDFNLAMDLHQKHVSKSKLKLESRASVDPLSLASGKYFSPRKLKLHGVKSIDAARKDEIKVSKLAFEGKSSKRKVMDQRKACNDLGSWNTIRSQGAEGSGITSARDVASTRTTSAERMREPMPRQGRKELISLLQKTMHTNSGATSVPAPMRKRVAAPPGKADGKLLIITPMPIHSTGIPVCGAGLRSNKGDLKKEGPCVGTKGFRAPEVLFRSTHQGPKLDTWSAGVTLLYLVIGKMPFQGDPEQNTKDIAKLRGSEDLWEVAKLHNREISFPPDLYDTQHLAATNLYDWCRRNTRRPDFLKVLPASFFDLLDKCLTVNPRIRISAEEALKHDFLHPCHEEMRQKKLLRLDSPLEPEINPPVHRYSNLLSAADS